MAPIEYADENKLTKLRQNNGWDFTSGSKRGRLEIMAEILCYCNQQKAKTNIMYKVNLNYAQLKKHLKSLTSQGLLTTNKNRYATTQKGSFQPRNVGDGEVLGVETEFRENLQFLGEAFRNFSVTSNISVTHSRIELSLTEYNSRVENARTNQTIDKYRVMAGQAPYIINSGISFIGSDDGFWRGFEAGLYYNVQGITLQYVGIADRPDIYTLPFHSLNFNANKTLGKEKRTQIGLKVENLLNDTKESVFKSFNVTDPFFTKLEPGITFNIKLSYALF